MRYLIVICHPDGSKDSATNYSMSGKIRKDNAPSKQDREFHLILAFNSYQLVSFSVFVYTMLKSAPCSEVKLSLYFFLIKKIKLIKLIFHP